MFQRPDGLIAGAIAVLTAVGTPVALGQEWQPDALVPGLIVVHVHEREDGSEVAGWLRGLGVAIVGMGKVSGVVVAYCDPGDEAIWCALARGHPDVRAAQQDRAGRSGFTIPPSEMPEWSGGNQPSHYQMHDLWFLWNTGQTIDPTCGDAQQGSPGCDINALQAWGLTQGSSSIRVAVLDTRVYLSHPEFAGRLATGYSYTCPRGTLSPVSCCVGSPCYYGPPEDNLGHGTPVAGVLGANVDNDTPSSVTEEQYAGVDPGCTIVPFRIAWGSAHPPSITLLALQDIISSYESTPIAHVINMSYDFGAIESPPSQLQVDLRNCLDTLKVLDCIVVNMAGNGGTGYADVRVPQAWNNTITVGATNNVDGLYGASGTGESVDFTAPGVGLYTVWCPETTGGCINGWEASQYNCGTSGASPIVAGVVSLLLAYADELNVTLTWDDVYDALKAGAVPLGTGWPNEEFGWGRVNAYETLLSIE